MTNSPETSGKPTPRTIDRTVRRAARMGRLLFTPLRLTSVLLPRKTDRREAPGAPPGIEQRTDLDRRPEPGAVTVRCIDYGPDVFDDRPVELDGLEALLDEPPVAPGRSVRWINVDGLNAYVVRQFMQEFGLHTLAAEDVLNTPQRPKLEAYDNHLFVVGRMIMVRDDALHVEQVSFFLMDGLLLTFQETAGDVWEPVRQRVRSGIRRIRRAGPDYLLYALLDALVDHGFPLLEAYGDELESMESPVMMQPEPAQLRRIHRVKRELALLRRVFWPTRDLLDTLYRGDDPRIADETRTFCRDVYDHAVQLMDIVETYREMATGLSDLYMSAVGNRMNEVMKTLTILASLFIPLSFLAGIFGMNFEHMPELAVGWMYPWGFWAISATIVIGLLIYFHRKRWL